MTTKTTARKRKATQQDTETTARKRATAELRTLVRGQMRKRQITNYRSLSDYLQISHRSAYNFMRAENAHPTLPLLTALHRAFDMDFTTLLCYAAPHLADTIQQLAIRHGFEAHDIFQRFNDAFEGYAELLHSPNPDLETLQEQLETLTSLWANFKDGLHQIQKPPTDYDQLYAYWQTRTPEEQQAFQTLLRIPDLEIQGEPVTFDLQPD